MKLISALTILLFSISPFVHAQRSNLLYELTFEESTELNEWWKEICCSHSLILSDSIKRDGKLSGRFEVSKTDPMVANGKRSELATPSFWGHERWYGMSVFFPENFLSDPEPEIVAQWHGTPDFDLGETWRSPPIALQVRNDTFYVEIRWATDKVNSNETISGRKIYNLGLVEKNEWSDWVFHVKFSYSSDAILEIWRNNQQVLKHEGPNFYNDENYPYFKIGSYKWPWQNPNSKSSVTKRVIFFDEVRIGSHCATYNDVAP